MKALCRLTLWASWALAPGLIWAGSPSSEFNVNTRYTVEAIELPNECEERVSTGLLEEIQSLVGQKFNPASIEDLAQRLRKELRARAVTHRVTRGSEPDQVKIVFEVKERPARFDISVPKFLYHAKQGWSAALESSVRVHDSKVGFGIVSDGDDLAERYAGVLARFEQERVGSDRVKLRFQFESYHNQWNRNTLAAANYGFSDTIYRTRQNFEPMAEIRIAAPLTVAFGASFQRFQRQFPAAQTQASNAAIAAVRYRRRIEGVGSTQDVDAGYSLRAATKSLASDYVYTRHQGSVRWMLTRGHTVLADEVSLGVISGFAPLFDRFLVGTANTLRGWNKFDLDPLGGSRLAHNSLEYRFHWFEIFYDTGSVWNRGQDPQARHSLGAGIRDGSFFLAVAFPVKSGRAEPIFMVGMNY